MAQWIVGSKSLRDFLEWSTLGREASIGITLNQLMMAALYSSTTALSVFS